MYIKKKDGAHYVEEIGYDKFGERTPQESYKRMYSHLKALLPAATEKQISKLLK